MKTRSIRCRIATAPLAVALAGLSTVALGQPGAEIDPVAAALFRSGRDLVKGGKFEAGCAELRLSLQRHAAASTLLNLARHCEERVGRIATAHGLYERALVLNRRTPDKKRQAALESIARKGIESLAPRLPHLHITIADPKSARARVGDSSIAIGVPIPLDPGEHTIEFSAPGFVSELRQVVLEEGKVTRLEFSLRQPAPAPGPPPVAASPEPAAAPKSGSAQASDGKASATPDSGIPATAWIAGGAGLVLSGVATYFALDAVAASDQLKAECGADLECDPRDEFDPGVLNSQKNRDIGLAVGFGSAGLVALTISLVSILSASPSHPAPQTRTMSWTIQPLAGGYQGSVGLRF